VLDNKAWVFGSTNVPLLASKTRKSYGSS